MNKWRQVSQRTGIFAIACLVLAWSPGCSRQLTAPGSVQTSDSGQLPFERVSDSAGISPTAAFASESIPVGTGVTIHLRLALSSADSRVGDIFEAVLDEPVVVAGQTVVPQGAPVTGKVVATRAARGRHDPGYFRLTLASIALNGKSIPLQTSSIFAKGRAYRNRSQLAPRGSESENESVADGANRNSSADSEPPRDLDRGNVEFSTGHRFTFRLARPLHLPN